jgi:hypothetical protein
MRRQLILCVFLLVLVRATLVLCLSDVFYYGEEFAKAVSGKALIDGIPLDYFVRNYGMHEGGGFVVAHLRALFFLVFDESLLAGKLAALTTSLALLLVIWRFVATHIGERAAFTAGLLVAVAPDSALRFSLLCLGTHFEGLIWITLILDGALRLSAGAAFGSRAALQLGLAAGFGLYASLQSLPASAAALLWVLWLRRARLQPREWLQGLGGLVLGALPLLLAVQQLGMAALRPVQVDSASGRLSDGPLGLAQALREFALWDWAAVAMAVWGMGSGLRHFPAVRLACLYGVLFLCSYLLSGLATEYAYWMFFLRLSALWWLGVLGACVVQQLAAKGSRSARLLALLGIGLVFIGNLLDFSRLAQSGRTGALAANWTVLAHTKTLEYDIYFDKLFGRIPGGDAHKLLIARSFREDPRLTLPAAAHAFAAQGRALEELLAKLRANLGADQVVAARGLGLAVVPAFGHDLASGFERIAAQEPGLRQPLAEAAGRVALGLKFDEAKLRLAIAAEVPSEWRESFLRGLGMRLYRLHRWREDLALDFLGTLPARDRAPLEQGWREAREIYTLR